MTGWQEGDRLAGGAGAQHAALPDPAVESAPVSNAGTYFAVAVRLLGKTDALVGREPAA